MDALPPEDGTILHVQRRVFLSSGEDGARVFVNRPHEIQKANNNDDNLIDNVFFQPIAGDGSKTMQVEQAQMSGLQFGMLDPQVIQNMSVVFGCCFCCLEENTSARNCHKHSMHRTTRLFGRSENGSQCNNRSQL